MTANEFFPTPDLDNPLLRPFWAAAAQRRLELPQCAGCAKFVWYPAALCPHCGGTAQRWVALPPRARVFSWAVVNRALHAPYKAIAPYVPVVVEFDAAPGVRLVTRLIRTDARELEFGKELSVEFEDLGYPQIKTGVLGPLVA
jgi:hypothetical protein